ncbi:MAG: glycosyltransferase [Candidatus Bipolaricaulaceae bacterium]
MPAPVELVVGVCTKDCASTVGHVLEVVDQGLAGSFPDHRALIVVSDGFSQDGTREVAGRTPTRAEKVVEEQRGPPGKGVGVRTILELAQQRGARAVALVDGDLLSVQPHWVKLLLEPILTGGQLVVPLYLRHPHDGVITNHVVYPLVNVLFGLGVRQPIGGEFGLSGELGARLLDDAAFPNEFGIDVFITVSGAVAGGRTVQAALGVKAHESTQRYVDPEALLVPMFHQVTGTLFRLVHHFRDHVRQVRSVRAVPQVGKLPAADLTPVPVDRPRLLARFRSLVAERVTGRATFLGKLGPEVVALGKQQPDQFSFPLRLWAEGLYRAVAAFAADPGGTLRVLEALWQGRYLGFVCETAGLSAEEAEARIQEQLATFWEFRPSLEELL